MSDAVELSFPVEADLLVLARLTAATVAARAGFSIEEVEDLRLVTEELCLSVIGTAKSGTVSLRLASDGGEITIECWMVPGGVDGSGGGASDELSARIIEALVDAQGVLDDGPRAGRWIRTHGGAGVG